MKIILTGAGGGHFYPLIAVTEKIKEECLKQKIIDAEFYFFSDQNYDEKSLLENQIKFVQIPAGKLSQPFAIQNIFSPFISLLGFFIALIRLFIIYPDIVFAKGGYASFPVLLAAKILFIPIFIHESDSVPGRTTTFCAKFAKRIAVSYVNAIKYFDIKKTAFTGQPIREKYIPNKSQIQPYPQPLPLGGEEPKKNILILGGSQGAEKINNIILQTLPNLLEKYNIIHQVGENNFQKIKIASQIILKDNPHQENYHYFSFADLSKYLSHIDLCITRAGSTLFELSVWGIPSIIIPISLSNGNHQKQNAFLFEQAGCAVMLEENNLRPNILLSTIDSILNDRKRYNEMQLNNFKSFKPEASLIIAQEIIRIGLSHNY